MDPVYLKNITALIEEKFLRINRLGSDFKDVIILQLEWVQQNKQFTPQADVVYDKSGKWQAHLNREIFRALSRIEMMLLLAQLNNNHFETAYQEFTAEQVSDHKLSRASFSELAEIYSGTDIKAYAAASLISAVTLSPEAIRRAEAKLGKDQFPYESVMFSGKTIHACAEIYPAYQALAEDGKRILKTVFPDDCRHWRYAFFLEHAACLSDWCHESGDPYQYLLKVNIWIKYWMDHALGFNGHIGAMTGSSFMTESVYARTKALNDALRSTYEERELDVFDEYSAALSSMLEIENASPKVNLLIVRTLSMLNAFEPSKARALEKYIKESNSFDVCSRHWDAFKSNKVATYLPAFLQNVVSIYPDDHKFLLKAIHWMSETLLKSDKAITSFRLIDTKAILTLGSIDFDDRLTSINENGEIVVSSCNVNLTLQL